MVVRHVGGCACRCWSRCCCPKSHGHRCVDQLQNTFANKMPRTDVSITFRNRCAHSINSSARARIVGDSARSSTLAVFILITSSNFLDCSIGRSPGIAPREYLMPICGGSAIHIGLDHAIAHKPAILDKLPKN